jgi:hypothetical protein
MQLGKWDVEVNGADYAVTIERSENGKDVVRVNGRVVAKPIGAEETERPITVAGWPYKMVRVNPNAYDLEVDEAAAATVHERTMETANQVLAHSDAPVNMKRSEVWSKLPQLGWVVIVAAVAIMLWAAKGPSYDKIAADRVKKVFDEMHAMKGSQFAITYWYKNKKTLDSTDMNIASDTFTKWVQAKDMYRQIGEWELIDSTVVKDAVPDTAIVHIKVEGNPYTLLVKKDLPIEWAE